MMRFFVVTVLLLTSIAWADVQVEDLTAHTAYGYIQNIGIPRGEAIRKAEENSQRIVGGLPATLGQYQFQV